MDRIEILADYFKAWIDNDIDVLCRTFSDDAIYSECYGPEYHGREQILKWFSEWNLRGRVIEWRIKRSFVQGDTVIAEWYFECEYDSNTDGFDGVTIADFNAENKIIRLCEFQSRSDHYYPYEK